MCELYLASHPDGGTSWASSKARRHEGLQQKKHCSMRFQFLKLHKSLKMQYYCYFSIACLCEFWQQHKALSLSWDECQSMKHQHWEPAFPNDCKNRKREKGGRGSVTWLWGPIILLGGGGWGWGEPWGPGGPCGIAQNKEARRKIDEGQRGGWHEEKERSEKKKWQQRGRETSRVTAGQRIVGAQEPKWRNFF